MQQQQPQPHEPNAMEESCQRVKKVKPPQRAMYAKVKTESEREQASGEKKREWERVRKEERDRKRERERGEKRRERIQIGKLCDLL